jgi:general nucleoside transport system ATP-binding protein
MAEMMVGSRDIPAVEAQRSGQAASTNVRLSIRGLTVEGDTGLPAVSDVSLDVRASEIVGVAGVSGNGQRELVEALIGQRMPVAGEIWMEGERYGATRLEMRKHRVFSLPEEPLRNACVGGLSVADNMALRNFDRSPLAVGAFLRRGAIRAQSTRLIADYKVKTPGPDAPIRTLSGGNVQRAVLARELSGDVSVLIVANPVFGLDFAAVAEIHGRILAARDAGAAVLLVSGDLDELLELSDRIVVMFDGRLVHEAPIARADVGVIGRCMAGHAEVASSDATVIAVAG